MLFASAELAGERFQMQWVGKNLRIDRTRTNLRHWVGSLIFCFFVKPFRSAIPRN